MKNKVHFTIIFSIISIFLCTLSQKKDNNAILINKLVLAYEANYLNNSIVYEEINEDNAQNNLNSDISNFIIPAAKRENKIPNISFIDEANIKYFIKDFSGQVVVLYLWASWCLSCVENLVTLNELKEKLLYNDILDIEIIPLTVDFKDRKKIEDLYQEKRISKLGLFADKGKSIMKTFAINFVPAIIIIDKDLKKAAFINHNVNWNTDEVYQDLLKLR